MAERYCKTCDGWHDLSEPWPHQQERVARADGLATPYFVSDNLGHAGIVNHADGRKYDSRSAYYKSLKAHGCEIIGNEKPKPFVPHKSKGSGADIKKALEQLRSRA